MNKKLLPLLLAVAIVFAASGCALPSASKTEAHEIVFPVSQKGRTEYNAAIYDTAPFMLSFTLPEGWTLREREPADGVGGEFLPVGVFSVMEIYDAGGVHAGAVGYNLCDIYEGEEDNP